LLIKLLLLVINDRAFINESDIPSFTCLALLGLEELLADLLLLVALHSLLVEFTLP
jgi:hypothetical protein